MEAMAEILEQELKEAVEDKNKKSFHRLILFLMQNVVSRATHEKETDNIRRDIKDLIDVMERKFEAVDQRFESIDQRFEAVINRTPLAPMATAFFHRSLKGVPFR